MVQILYANLYQPLRLVRTYDNLPHLIYNCILWNERQLAIRNDNKVVNLDTA